MKGLLYKIVSNSTPLVYYGSTCKTLAQRMSSHYGSLKRLQNGHLSNNCTSFQILLIGDARMELVREVEVSTRNELYVLEGELQSANPCVNRQVASKFNIHLNKPLSTTIRAQYMRAWRLKNSEKNAEQGTKRCSEMYETSVRIRENL